MMTSKSDKVFHQIKTSTGGDHGSRYDHRIHTQLEDLVVLDQEVDSDLLHTSYGQGNLMNTWQSYWNWRSRNFKVTGFGV